MKHLIMLISCSIFIYSAIAQDDNASLHLKTPYFEGVILEAKCAAYTVKEPLKRFTPTKEEVMLLEKSLREQIREINKQHPRQNARSGFIEDRLPEYKRQYIGYVNAEGEKVIYVNCFTDEIKEKDFCEELIVMDGGSAYWQIHFNVKKNEFFKFSVNGEA
ncbi:MAG: hypothetical protein ACFB0B_20080 [Thermonemataceae bacterium]